MQSLNVELCRARKVVGSYPLHFNLIEGKPDDLFGSILILDYEWIECEDNYVTKIYSFWRSNTAIKNSWRHQTKNKRYYSFCIRKYINFSVILIGDCQAFKANIAKYACVERER